MKQQTLLDVLRERSYSHRAPHSFNQWRIMGRHSWLALSLCQASRFAKAVSRRLHLHKIVDIATWLGHSCATGVLQGGAAEGGEGALREGAEAGAG